ncbi:unnamed protein product [Peniophora sp. CBMAI 1063]|nr:unnamed protein product [Peniophora sp. CBMAI 1063]
MPKRPKTPPPADDEPKYLSVVHPYPKTHPNMELEHDQIRVCFWLACCIGGNPRLHDYPLRALYYRPKSGGILIIEVSRDFENWNGLLGKHQWSDFVMEPTTEERDKYSSIFYCTYNRGRDVQKAGWKRIDVQPGWYNGWSAHNQKIRWPYPKTGWCELPKANMNDPNQPQLCRPLPAKDFKPPPKAAIPAVGSPAWHEWKKTGVLPAGPKQKQAAAPILSGAWGQGKPRVTATTASTPSVSSVASPPNDPWSTSAPPGLASPLGPPPGLNTQSHKTPTPELSSGSSTSSGGRTASSGAKQLVPKAADSKFDWAEEMENESKYGPASYGDSLITGYAPSSRAVSHSSYVTSPDAADEADYIDEYEEDDDMPKVANVSRAMRGLSLGSAAPVASSLIQTPIGAPDDDEDPPENLWADANEPKTQVLWWRGNCPEHGPVCPKGICKVYKAMKKQKEREEREAIEAKNGTSTRGGNGRGKPRDKKPKPSERENWIRPQVRPQDRSQSHSSGPSPIPSRSTSTNPALAADAARPSKLPGASGWGNEVPDGWGDWDAGDGDDKSVASSAHTAWGNSGGQDDDDARSVASAATQRTQSTSGWGKVSVSGMPWGQAASSAKNASARGGPVEDDDARSVASVATARSQSTTGWSSVDVGSMPWGGAASNNAPARGFARGGGRGNARGGRGGDAWGGRGRGTGRGGREGNAQPGGPPAAPQTPVVKPKTQWAAPVGEDDWGPPIQASDPW